MIQLPYIQFIKTRIEEKRRFIQVVFGPRQVGKTTTIAQVTESIKMPFYSISTDAIPASNQGWLEEQWEIARLMMAQKEASEFLLVIDDVQKFKNWSERVKLLWDNDTKENRNIKVVLIGTPRLEINQGLQDAASKSFQKIYMGHWSFTEMNEAFGWNFAQYAWFGGYPGAASLIGDEDRWKKYISDSLLGRCQYL